ncbi:potassium uptake protein, TrkH family protein [Psychromonas sp. CNPT3]|uniref:TrkH family potassium uptake protein n=1 Tax=Psychromonas sp. CNPT3 TaxID=314282 RepID=UPI00006E5095|nr:TrkH family potassium uptake protein [Psychromonas sp. CNPT3]AGH82438.1 potassium uptake protein, TrkH family protein [Psychromonas sp. CNPT3]
MAFRSIIRIVGLLIGLFSLTMLPPVFVASIYQDGGGDDFLAAFAVTLFISFLLWAPNRHKKTELRVRDGFLIVVIFWITLGSVGAIPFLMSSRIEMSVASAFFESFSGLTTTGATVIEYLDSLPKSILFYRQMLQWFGGMGIIVLAVAILPMLGVGGMQLYRAETPGPIKDTKMTPRIAETAKALWYIYLCLTVACMLAFWLAGMSLFDALGHSFSTVSIGGFSTHDASIGYFNSDIINTITVVFLLISGVNYALHFSAFSAPKFSLNIYKRDPEVRMFLYIQIILTSICFITLMNHQVYTSIERTFSQALFQAVSISTTAGFSTTSFSNWPLFLPVLLVLSSFIGGCAGSTGGGLKVIRILLLNLQGLRELKRLVHPKAVYKIKLANKAVPDRVIEAVWGFFSTYALVFIVCMLALAMTGMDELSSFSATVAMLNNLGPGLGQVAVHFNEVNESSKWIMIIAMLFGRLEIFTLLVLFTPVFWKN